MSRSSLLRTVLLAALSAPLVLAAACSSDSSPTQDPNADILRQGEVTDGELQTVLKTTADDWPWAGGQFAAPADQATLSADAPFEFVWHSASTDAAAAGAPDVTQMVYLLLFSTPSHPHLLRVFTTLSNYTPDASAWKALVNVNEPITLGITTATFDGSALTEDGGPHAGQTLTFSIE